VRKPPQSAPIVRGLPRGEARRKILLPIFQLSELTSEIDPRALVRTIEHGNAKDCSRFSYHYRFVSDDASNEGIHCNLFPIVLDKRGAPWTPSTLFLLDLLEGDTTRVMGTFASNADDLGDFKEWLDTHDDPEAMFLTFPKIKLQRPTYRYRGHLRQLIKAGELAPTLGNRRMGTAVRLYTFLIENEFMAPANPPWVEKTFNLGLSTSDGRPFSKKVVTTDLRIPTPTAEDPLEQCINDGGKLRPLTGDEQDWVLSATLHTQNTECFLIQIFMLSTGARIQTACTLRLSHFLDPAPRYARSLTGDGDVYRLKAGPGTGIDTKNNKQGVLHVPRNIYELLHTYALSRRATIRRERLEARHTGIRDPYLFVTQQGNPYYASNEETQRFNPEQVIRHAKVGQPIRQFIRDYVVPRVRQRHDPRFQYRIHDLRASFGMNVTELLAMSVRARRMTLHRARLIVRDLLWHNSLTTTDLYLDYRSKMQSVYAAINGLGEQLQKWTVQAMNTITSDDASPR